MPVWDVQNLGYLMFLIIIRFLRHKNFFKLQVQALNTSPQPSGESVQRDHGHCLGDACYMSRWQRRVQELTASQGSSVTGPFLQLVPQLGHLSEMFCTPPRCRSLVTTCTSPPPGFFSPRARSLCCFVIDAGNGHALCFFGPLSLQIGSHNGVQR